MSLHQKATFFFILSDYSHRNIYLFANNNTVDLNLTSEMVRWCDLDENLLLFMLLCRMECVEEINLWCYYGNKMELCSRPAWRKMTFEFTNIRISSQVFKFFHQNFAVMSL